MVVGTTAAQQKKSHSMLLKPWRHFAFDQAVSCTMPSPKVVHQSQGASSSYKIAVDSEQVKIQADYLTPKTLKQRNKCFSFRTVNTIKRTASCCSKNMCFARSSSKSQNTSPYGSCISSYLKSKTVFKSTRRSIITSLSRKTRKASSFKNRAAKKSNLFRDYNANASGCISAQAGAFFVQNVYLRQTKVEITVKIKQDVTVTQDIAQKEKDSGYSAGFAPKITSTPMRKSLKTFDAKGTSDYFSRPSSGEGSSGKTKYDNNETESFLRKETSRQMKQSENQEVFQEYDSALCPCNKYMCNRCEGRLKKKHCTSTPRQDKKAKTSHRFANQKLPLPGLYPIGAPSAASSPIDLQRFQAVRSTDSPLLVWRPWC